MTEQTCLRELDSLSSNLLPKNELFCLIQSEILKRTQDKFGKAVGLSLGGLVVDIGCEKKGRGEVAWINFATSDKQLSRYEIQKQRTAISYDGNQNDVYVFVYRMVRVNANGTRDLYNPLKQGRIPLLLALKHIYSQNPI